MEFTLPREINCRKTAPLRRFAQSAFRLTRWAGFFCFAFYGTDSASWCSFPAAWRKTADNKFLDELTTGLDPEARRDIWGLIRKINDSGTTVLMVSHFMEEVECLADRVILMKAGKILSMGTVAGMETDFGCSHKVSFRVQNGAPFQPDEMRLQTGIQKLVCKDRDITAFGNGGSLQETVRNYLSARRLTYGNFQFQTVSLENLYLFYTGYGSGRSERDGIQ